MGTKSVPVVSFVSHEGATVDSGVSSGGFDWFFNQEQAEKAFLIEVERNKGCKELYRVRYLLVEVPEELVGQELTDYIDFELLDEIEVTGTPIMEAFVIDPDGV